MAKNHFIRARVAGWEKFVISENARKARMTESEFVRRAALEKEVVVIFYKYVERRMSKCFYLRMTSGRCIRTHGER